MLQYEGKDDAPMGNGTQQNKHVPDGVVMWALVVCKEIGAGGVKDAFTQEQDQGEDGELLYDGGENEQYTPSHDEVDG